MKQSSALEHAVDDRLREVFVVKVGFHSVTTPSRRQACATVFGRSNTASKGLPPIALK